VVQQRTFSFQFNRSLARWKMKHRPDSAPPPSSAFRSQSLRRRRRRRLSFDDGEEEEEDVYEDACGDATATTADALHQLRTSPLHRLALLTTAKGTNQQHADGGSVKSRNNFWKHATTTTNTTATTTATFVSSLPKLLLSASALKTALAVTLALYALNQKALLPKPMSRVVSKVLFWPTLPITVLRRVGKWTTVVDDTVVMGGAPFEFAGFPERLREQYNVSIHVSHSS